METLTVEWKREWKDEILRTVCSFANSGGGTITVGVNDDCGGLVGVRDPNDVMKKISETVANKLALYPAIDLDRETGIITITVEKSDIPVEYDGRYYLRTGNTTHEAKGREYDRMVAKRLNISWIDVPVEGMGVDSLDPYALKHFRRMAMETGIIHEDNLSAPDDELLQRMRLVVGGSVTRACVLLFHPDPERVIIGSNTRMGMFDGSELLFQDVMDGPLMTRIGRIMDTFRSKYQTRRVTYEGITRVEVEQYPERALRECVLNALMHNDYSSGTPVQIRAWGDRVMISDCGGLPERWTMEDLLSLHVSHPPNPTIANAFFLAGLVEGWGRGIERILDSYADHPDKTPEFKANEYEFSVILRNLDPASDAPRTEETPERPTIAETVPERPLMVLRILDAGGDMSLKEVVAGLGKDGSVGKVRNDLRLLMDSGLVSMTSPERPRSRSQRYRVTPRGRDAARRRAGRCPSSRPASRYHAETGQLIVSETLSVVGRPDRWGGWPGVMV